MKCPLFKTDCGDDCEWRIRERRIISGVQTDQKTCVVVALAHALAEDHLGPRTKKV